MKKFKELFTLQKKFINNFIIPKKMQVDHSHFMQEAVKCSHYAIDNKIGGPFGCVIVRDNQIIARAWNTVTTTNDPTAHAEVNCIRKACQELNDFKLDGCSLYTSCEPCPMCLAAIYWARIEKIYFGNSRIDAANIDFDDNFLYEEIKTPNEERKIPIVQIGREDAIKAFEKWGRSQDKVEY
jgi:tRNA(Arg) A34 adenosine deaminase TadA